jgi:simple sugar transport system substrate-binding protein
MNLRKHLACGVLGLLGLLTLAACDRAGDGTTTGAPTTTGSSGTRPKLGYTIHVLNDFTGVVKRGAEAAGADLGADVDVQGPPDADPNAAIAIFEGMAQRGVGGLVVMPMPGEVWVTPIRRAADAGVPVLTANVTSPNSAARAWFGQDEYQSGVVLAGELRKLLAAAGKAEGKVVVGVCAPGVDVLAQRYEGLKAGMAGSGFDVTEPYDVRVEKTANYGAWEGLAGANPDVVAMVGLCSMDLPNLAELKRRSNATWVAAGYDLNVDTLDAIRAGTVQVSVGQHPYLQGYLPVRALVEHVRGGKPLPQGWVDVGTEVVTRANVEDVYLRETDPAAERRWYADDVAKRFPDLAAAAKPMPAGPR